MTKCRANMEEYDMQLEYFLENDYTHKGLYGILNPGNRCYMISILQCLINTLPLTDFFTTNQHLPLLHKQDTAHMRALLYRYKKLLEDIYTKQRVANPVKFISVLAEFDTMYQLDEEQDSQEFLLKFLEFLHVCMKHSIIIDIQGNAVTDADRLTEKCYTTWKTFFEDSYSVITEMFYSIQLEETRCTLCKTITTSFVPSNIIQLTIQDDTPSTIHELLDEFITERTVDGSSCDVCMTERTSKTSLWYMSDQLIICFSRYSEYSKRVRVEYPVDSDLDLTKYISPRKQDKNNYIYTLYAVNYHVGSISSGHYYTKCKNPDGNWYEFNDTSVTLSNSRDIVSSDAYILFFYRKRICG